MENTNQLYLIGMMGSGKSSTAKALSLSLGWNFIDIDNELTKSFDMSINELFLRGEENFRKLEFTELQKHILKENAVIACLLYTSPSPRDLSTSRMPSSA